jgi:hypothetical protein
VQLDHIKEELRVLKDQNDRQRRKVDGLFTEKAQ